MNWKTFTYVIVILIILSGVIYYFTKDDEKINVCGPFDSDIECMNKIIIFAHNNTNPEICKNITESKLKNICEFEVLTNVAENQNDCSSLNGSYRDDCESIKNQILSGGIDYSE